MSHRPKNPAEDLAHLLAAALGQDQADDLLRDLTAALGRVLEKHGLADQEPKRTAQPRNAGRPQAPEVILQRALGPFGVEVDNVKTGRPTTAMLRATEAPISIGQDIDDWPVVLVPGEAPVTCVLVHASRRNHGHAPFRASRFLDDARVDAQLYFFVLVEGERVWVLTRSALRHTYEALTEGKRVASFSLEKRPGTMRLTLPKALVGFDLDQAIHRNDPARSRDQ
jgi:hypothetical protein